MQNRYSVGGWMDFRNMTKYEDLPDRVGVKFEHDEKMYIFEKDQEGRGYYTERSLVEMLSFINNNLISRGKGRLYVSKLYKPIFNLDYCITLGKVELEYLKAYVHMWRDKDIIGFTVRRLGRRDYLLEKTIRDKVTGEAIQSIAFNIPNNKFLAMDEDRLYTLEELGLDDEPEEGPILYKDDHIWKVGELYPGEFDKEDD